MHRGLETRTQKHTRKDSLESFQEKKHGRCVLLILSLQVLLNLCPKNYSTQMFNRVQSFWSFGKIFECTKPLCGCCYVLKEMRWLQNWILFRLLFSTNACGSVYFRGSFIFGACVPPMLIVAESFSLVLCVLVPLSLTILNSSTVKLLKLSGKLYINIIHHF